MDNGESPNGVRAEPEVIRIDPNHIRMNANSIRMLKVATGRSLTQLLQSEEDGDRIQAMAFLELRRRHPHLDPAALWELAAEVDLEMADGDLDPLGTASSTATPPSLTTGDSTPTPSTT